MTELEVLQFISLKMFYAVLCGAIIGFERRLNSSPAGFKTQILVCVGAMLFATFPTLTGDGLINETPRVIGQIVSGIGFLGAGTIIRNRKNVSGLTTAAWIWFSAAVGVMIGIGYGLVATFTTITLTAVITIFRYIEKKYFGDHYAALTKSITDEESEKEKHLETEEAA